MPSLPIPRRRDPRWQEDGPSARRERRLRRLRESAAFTVALLATLAAAALWVVRLGLTGLLRG